MAISHWLSSSGQEWQFHIVTDMKWSRMAISHFYWHLVVKNGNFTFLLKSSWSSVSYKKWKSSVKEEQNLKWAQIWHTNLIWLMSSPHMKLPEKRVSSLPIYTINENPFETVNWWENDRWCPPPMQNCLRKEWALCISIPWQPIWNSQLIGIYKK